MAELLHWICRCLCAAAVSTCTSPTPALAPTVEPISATPRIKWRFEARAEIVEPECNYSLSEEQPAQCDPSSRFKLVAIAPSGAEKIVFEGISGTDNFDNTRAELTAVPGSTDPNIRMLRVFTEFGADFYAVHTDALLVRIDPETPDIEVLFRASGATRIEMDSCVRLDTVYFAAGRAGYIVAIREQGTTLTPQDGVDLECEPVAVKRTVLKRIRVDRTSN